MRLYFNFSDLCDYRLFVHISTVFNGFMLTKRANCGAVHKSIKTTYFLAASIDFNTSALATSAPSQPVTLTHLPGSKAL